MTSRYLRLLPILLALTAPCYAADAHTPIKVAIVGLVHGHVQGFLKALPTNPNAQLVAIVEPDQALAHRYAERFHLYALDTNLVVMQILAAARESANTGKTIDLKPLPAN